MRKKISLGSALEHNNGMSSEEKFESQRLIFFLSLMFGEERVVMTAGQ